MAMSKYEMAERIAGKIQRSDKAIDGINEGALTVAFMSLRLAEVKKLYAHHVDLNYMAAWGK